MQYCFFININRQFILLKTTKIKKYQRCIKLVYTKKRYLLILTNKGLEYPDKTYCIYCAKSYKNFLIHHCKASKCAICFQYTFKNEYSSIVCKKKTGNFSKQCQVCLKTIYDEDCALRHAKLSTTNCTRVKICQRCNVYYRSEHMCHVPKCSTCFLHHHRENFCNIRVKKNQNEEFTSFFITKINDCIIVSNINNGAKIQCQYSFAFHVPKNKVFVFEKYGTKIPPYTNNCILEESCYVQGRVKKSNMTYDTYLLYLPLHI